MKLIFYSSLILVSILCDSKSEVTPSPSLFALDRISSKDISKKYTKSYISSIKNNVRFSDDLIEVDERILSYVKLWQHGEYEYLVLSWHRERNRECRMAILSLIICNRIDIAIRREKDLWHDFFTLPHRLVELERVQRTEEVQIVIKNAPEISNSLILLFKGVVDSERLKGFEFTSDFRGKPDAYKNFLNLNRP